jgi:Fic family protein
MGDYAAFAPNHLPPSIAFNPPLVSRLSHADRAIGNLRGIAHHIKNPYLLIRPFVTREAVLSSRIEGTQASITDLFFFEAAPAESPRVSDVREVMNYVSALHFALSPDRKLPVSLRLMRDMHRVLMDGVRGDRYTPGEFRSSQNWIGPPGCTLNDATFVPPPVPEMHQALDNLERYLHTDDGLPPLVRLAIIHYQFEAIHPFLDGNGRIGRLLIAILLCEWKVLDSPLLYLSAFFERRKQEYYDRLLAVSLEGKWEEWVAYFLEGVESQAQDAADRARRLAAMRDLFVDRIKRAKGSATLFQLVDAIVSSPAITVPHAAEVTGLSYQGAQFNISRLVELGILTKARKQRPQLYYAADVVGLLEDELQPDASAAVQLAH